MTALCEVLIVAVGCEPGRSLSAITGEGADCLVLPAGLREGRRRQVPAAGEGDPTLSLLWAEPPGQRQLALMLAEVARRLGAHTVILAGSSDAVELLGHTARALEAPVIGEVVEVRGRVLRAAEADGVQLGYPLDSTRGVALFHVPEGEAAPLAKRATSLRPAAGSVKIRAGRRTAAWITGHRGRLGSGPIVIQPLPTSLSTREIVQIQDTEGARQLGESPVVLAAGAGLGDAGTVAMLDAAARKLGASLGATRVVTDAGWAPEEVQIGTTGTTVSPLLYVAIGISGAPQHTGGLEAPGRVIAVNTDPAAPIFGLADRAILADGPAVVQELWELAQGDGGAHDGDRGR
ncbi:MAG: FAD-binding protein [Nitrospiraceae bacterium]|nr:FAD-binding protein [Nitrospiraceae bacterium]